MDNKILQLEPNEHLFFSEGNSTVETNEEDVKFFISNLNLIFVNKITHEFKKPEYEVVKLPINKIKVINNEPQVKIEKGDYDSWNLVIHFNRGVKKIVFYYESKIKKNFKKKHVEKIANIIIHLHKHAQIASKFEAKINNTTMKANNSIQRNQNSQDHKLLIKKGFRNYDTVISSNDKYYVDYQIKKFAIKNSLGLKVLKFKDFKGYSIDYDNPKSSTNISPAVGGAFKGAVAGNILAKTFIGKSAGKVGAKVGAIAGGVANSKNIRFSSKLAARVVIRYKSHNETIEVSDVSLLENYRLLFDMLDKISRINEGKRS